MLTRRTLLTRTALAALGATLGGARLAAQPARRRKVLFFSKSSNFEHDVIKRRGGKLSFAEQVLADLGPAHGIEFTFTKDGSRFTSEWLDQFDAFFFYTSGNLLEGATDAKPGHEGAAENRPMTPAGKAAFLDAIRRGKGFVGTHAAADTFHTGETVATNTNQARTWRYRILGDQADPYTRMLGASFIIHGVQQTATMRVVDHHFPGFESLGDSFSRKEEWYSLTDFSHDLHVLLVQETAGMKGPLDPATADTAAALKDNKNLDYNGHAPYWRPPYPATWARKHGEGRVFYTSMGHGDNGLGENTWTSPVFQQILFGGLSWAVRDRDADVTPNIEQVTPGAWQLPPYSVPVAGLPRKPKS